ncbi:MAG: hypothetical protein JO257_29410 [Deltaproteobacteria bacterium]|nr:hypothetical protein [Deltaproteobacteria bacterium]
MVGARLLLVVVAVAGCTARFKGSATQPNPVKNPTETLRNSESIKIVTGDMELNKPVSNGCTGQTRCDATTYHNEHYPLINEASFTLVSRDRLRFHVQVDHKWSEYADLNNWDVELVDDQGRHWTPESVEHARVKLLTQMWDQEQRTAICSSQGRDGKGDCIQTMGFADDGWRRRQPLGSLSVYRGKADFVFYQRDLFNSRVKWLKLLVKRSGEVFEFTWRFEDTVASE